MDEHEERLRRMSPEEISLFLGALPDAVQGTGGGWLSHILGALEVYLADPEEAGDEEPVLVAIREWSRQLERAGLLSSPLGDALASLEHVLLRLHRGRPWPPHVREDLRGLASRLAEILARDARPRLP